MSSHLQIKPTLPFYHCQRVTGRVTWLKPSRDWILAQEVVFFSCFQFGLCSFEVAGVYSSRLFMESPCSSFCHVCIRQLCFLLAGQNVVYWPPLSPSVLGCWNLVTRLSQKVRCTLHFHPNLVFWSPGCFYSGSFILSFCAAIGLPYLHSTCWLNALSWRSVSKMTLSSLCSSPLFALKSECDVFLWHGFLLLEKAAVWHVSFQDLFKNNGFVGVLTQRFLTISIKEEAGLMGPFIKFTL